MAPRRRRAARTLTPAQIHRGADVLAAQKRPDLIDTARCVLDNGGDVTVSAEQLHIHRTTLYYRLDRIEELTGVNLRLAAGRDALHMALHLARVPRTPQTEPTVPTIVGTSGAEFRARAEASDRASF